MPSLAAPSACVVTALALTACAAGGGPFVGYGTKHGLVYGAEVSAGLPVAQVAFGAQQRDLIGYLRFDLAGNTAGSRRLEDPYGYGGRFGAGYGWGRTHRGGVFATGASAGYAFRHVRCREAGIVGTLGIEFRYVGAEAQFVAVSRLDAVSDYCLD